MKPQRLKGLNDSQWKALKKALSYSRVTRFSSVREFVDALDEHQDEPFRVEEPDRFADIEDERGVSKSLLILLLVASLAAAAGYQYGYLDPLLEKLSAAGPESPAVIEGSTPTIHTPEIAVPVTDPEPVPRRPRPC